MGHPKRPRARRASWRCLRPVRWGKYTPRSYGLPLPLPSAKLFRKCARPAARCPLRTFPGIHLVETVWGMATIANTLVAKCVGGGSYASTLNFDPRRSSGYAGSTTLLRRRQQFQPSRVLKRLRRRGGGHGRWQPVVASPKQLTKSQKSLGPGATPIKLNVNGRERVLPVEPRTTLLEALRYKLNLTGAKPVSVDDSSGASMVIIDGKPASANTVLAIACVGKKIQTAESLGGDKPDAVPVAFLHNDAMQCGFCTPGFVVAVRAFLDKNPKATEKQIREGLNSNLCRCGTYANVIMAAVEVVKGGSRG